MLNQILAIVLKVKIIDKFLFLIYYLILVKTLKKKIFKLFIL